jgi:peroxiredoxin
MKNKTVILLALLIVGFLVVFMTVKPVQKREVARVGSKSPNFELLDINNNKIKLDDLKGSVVFINFWATWCQSCIEEIPSMDRLFKSFSTNSEFKPITILYRDSLNNALNFLKTNNYSLPIYLNPDESAARSFGITGVPETYIIDKRGILVRKVIGPADWDSPNEINMIAELLKR